MGGRALVTGSPVNPGGHVGDSVDNVSLPSLLEWIDGCSAGSLDSMFGLLNRHLDGSMPG